MKKKVNDKYKPTLGADILIDDSMWGFPLGSVLEGVYSFKQDKFLTEAIGMEHFRQPLFKKQTYLDAIAEAALKMVTELQVAKTDRILVCRGFCNSAIERKLRDNGFKYIFIGTIGEPLQTYLETAAWRYIESIGYENYYDPKGMSTQNIVTGFNSVIKWVIKNNRFDLCKTGWKYFTEKKYMNLK